MSENFGYKNPGQFELPEQAYLANLVCHWLAQSQAAGERVISQVPEELLDRIQNNRAILAYSPLGTPIGCIFLHPLATGADGIENGEPGSLYVVPEFRGRRLGVNLVNHLASEFPDVRMYATIKDDAPQVGDRSLRSFGDPKNKFVETSFRQVDPQAIVDLCISASCFISHQNGHLSCANESLEHGGSCHVTVRHPILK